MLENTVVVVTGGSGYLGRCFVEAIARDGAIAVSADVDHAQGEAQMAQLASAGFEQVAFFPCDTTSTRSPADLMEWAPTRFGRVDALVNNAYPRNARYGRKMEEVAYEDFVENLGTHVGGYFLAAQRFIRAFREQGRGGIIINMGSI